MTDDSIQALGPLFGADFITIEVDDQTGSTFALEIFPDSANPDLKRNGLATQFYYMPKRVYLARKQDSPEDFDFSVVLFKGLMTSEDTLGLSGIPSEPRIAPGKCRRFIKPEFIMAHRGTEEIPLIPRCLKGTQQ